jgi:hypothetical protein
VIPDKFQRALPTLAFGRLLNWMRESEITADRAGMLCCQNPKSAYSAMIRQMHGLPAEMKILDPEDPTFDEERIIRNFQRWQYEPLVKFIVYAKRFSADSPFIPDRLAALKGWVKSGRYDELLRRGQGLEEPKILTLETIVLRNIAPPGAKSRLYLVAKTESGDTLLKTSLGPPKPDVFWDRINVTTGTANGQPLFFEVWEDTSTWDRLVGGFHLQVTSNQSDYNVAVSKDWNERTTDTNPSFAKVRLRVRGRVDANEQ